MTITVLDLIEGHVLDMTTQEKLNGDALDYMVNRKWIETDSKKHTIYAVLVDNDFVAKDKYGAVSGGFVGSGAVAHTQDRTTPSWEISFGNGELIGEIIDPQDFKVYGISKKILNSLVSDVFKTDAEAKAFLDNLQPFVSKMQEKLWAKMRGMFQSFCINCQTVGSLPASQLPFGEVAVSANSPAKTYYPFANYTSVADMSEPLMNAMYDAFAMNQTDVEGNEIMTDAPSVLLTAAGFHSKSKYFVADKVSNTYQKSPGDLLNIVSSDNRLVGSYKDPSAANANDFMLFSENAEIYFIGRNVNDTSRKGVYVTSQLTPEGGLQITLNVTLLLVVESGIGIMKNKGTV